jgi:hypothetical protein
MRKFGLEVQRQEPREWKYNGVENLEVSLWKLSVRLEDLVTARLFSFHNGELRWESQKERDH